MRRALCCTAILLCLLLVGAGALALAADFQDVPQTFWAWPYIQGVSTAGIALGYAGGLYRPDDPVTRDQMAVYIARALAKGDANVPSGPATPSFPDVPTTYWAYKQIEYVKAQDIVQGYPDGAYQPTDPVNRGQMAVYISRSIASPTGEAGLADYTPPATASFPDVPTTHWAYKYVEYAKANDIVQGYPDGYHPDESVNRAQMAVYICRAFGLETPAARYDIGDYFPIADGDSWVYAAGNSGRATTVSGTVTVGGKTYARFLDNDGGAMYWLLDETGLHLGGGVNVDGSVTVTLGYDPAFAFPRIIAVGDTATLTTQVSVNGTAAGEGSFTYKLLGAEPVTVKAGTFAGCLKFEMQITIPGTADQHFSLWFAPGIGIVKQDSRPFGGTDWSELVAASLGGVIIPTQSQLVTDYWPFAQGNTWTSQWTGGGGSYTQTETVNGTVVISGKTYFRLVYSDGDQDFFLADADGIHMGGSLKSGQQSTAVPPLTIPNGLQVGQPVLETSTIYVGNASQGTMTLKVTLLGTETVFAPAGVFPFCKKIELRMRQPGETADKVITTWYAEKVGPVKEHEVKADSTVEDSVLQSATVGGVHYPQ